MHEQHHEVAAVERIEPPISVSHFFKVIGAYLPIIALSLAAVAVGYLIVALAMYIHAPSQRVTTMTFRLEFEGADRGEYPNGTKFSSAEIISTPVLIKVFKENNLARFTTFNKFAHSMFIVEANTAQDRLAREYQSKLSDPRLTAVDRERIQREYELKLAGLTRSEYAINYMYEDGENPIPQVMVQKVLHDILRDWAQFVSREQHVLEYRVPVLSPDMIAATRIEDANPIIATEVLRAKILRVIANIDELRSLPSAELVRAKRSGLSLNDIRVRLDDIVRFRLEPLVPSIAMARLEDRESTIRFLETQVAYDARELDLRQRMAEAARTTLAMYSGQSLETPNAASPPPPERTPTRNDAETVMPQLSETFLDRMIQITSSAADHEYRQGLADRYRTSAEAVAPAQQAVEYDRAVLALVRSPGGSGSITPEAVAQQIGSARDEVRQLVTEIHEIYTVLSGNLNPSTELMTALGATSRVDRTMSIKRLGLYGLLTLFIALPLILFAVLIHNRIREEDDAASLDVVHTTV